MGKRPRPESRSRGDPSGPANIAGKGQSRPPERNLVQRGRLGKRLRDRRRRRLVDQRRLREDHLIAATPPPASLATRRRWIGLGVLGFLIILGISIGLAFLGHRKPTVVVQQQQQPFSRSPRFRLGGLAVREPGGFDWELWALILTGLGTTALATVTGLLAFTTWQDVRSSRQIAEAAQETNELARAEQERRPQLSISRPDQDIYSVLEAGEARIRLPVYNATDKRASRHTRVLVPDYTSWLNRPFTLGSPSLGWARATDAPDGSLTIFAGSSRPVELGVLTRAPLSAENDRVDPVELAKLRASPTMTKATTGQPIMWCLKLMVPPYEDSREYIVGGSTCIVRLVVGSDEAEAVEYDVKLLWNGNAENAQAALDSVEITIGEAGTLTL